MIFIMAWRNIWRNKLRSSVIVLSVVIGILAGIAVLALYKGMMRSRIRTVIDAEVSHIQIHDTSFKKDYEPVYIIQQPVKLLNTLSAIPQIKFCTARSITQGLLATATGSAGVQINGVVPEEEYQVSKLKDKIVDGKGFDSLKKNQVIIGRKLAEKMKVKTGSKLVLTFTDTAANIVSSAFKVAAIYQSDNAPLDERNVYITKRELNGLLGIDSNFHEVALLLKTDEDVKSVKQQLNGLLPGYLIESWSEISPETELMVNTVDIYSYIIIVIIMFALAFGIINTMLMAILERTREIGMMTALGLNRIKMFWLVLTETVLLTLTGTPVGLATGWLLCNYYGYKGLDLSGMGKEMMSSFGYSTLIYPEFPMEKLAGVMMIVMGTAILSCLFPAIKALKLQPVEALRQ
jgi:ABC-type lipoprotein release transport system permease subunit